MRSARWLLLVAIVAILGGVGVTYVGHKRVLREQSPPRPRPLSPELSSSADHWHYTRTDGSRKVYYIEAEEYTQSKDSSRAEAKGIKLELYNKDASAYDLVTSAAATLTTSDNRFYSDGDVEITLGMPAAGEPEHTLVSIKSSGISVDPDTGRAETDRPATFVFRNGEGKATGAIYDPASHELLMKQDAELNWKPPRPNAKPIKVEAGSLTYLESTSEIWLKPWGRLTRENTVVEGQDAVVHFEELEGAGEDRDIVFRQVEANKAHGSDAYPNRKLQYAADWLHVDFDDDGVVSKIAGRANAQVTSVSPTAETTVKSDNVEMNFANADGDSVLDRVTASGHAVATTKPLPVPGRQLDETNVLRSDRIDMRMRFGGREIESVVTPSAGTLEFLPNLPTERHRTLDASRIDIAYGPRNEIASFHATGVKTRTEPTADERKRNRQVSTTSSRELTARFDPKTGRVATIEQPGDFVYDEGDRHARAASATEDEEQETILLRTAARMWDATGSASADTIRLNQRTGDFTAEGKVNSSRLPDRDQKKSTEMLSGDQPLQAQAPKMTSSNRGRAVRYEGGALMWQGANRIQADAIDLDRDKHTLAANGNVVTSLWDQPQDAQPAPSGTKGGSKTAPPANPVLTVTRAPRMTYIDSDKVAFYSGGVTLVRGGLNVKSKELTAYLADSGDSRLEKALADGAVEIVQTAAGLPSRTGTGDHGEYYEAEQKVIVSGKPAKLVDGGNMSEGLELTYYANDDRLLVNGVPKEPVVTRITRAPKKAP
ncbi:MAG: LPS export ABC transporter periplasmic protein LptC [Bryobacteraceae bacterium]|jgi:lipopolysaccharide export system protein LptA